MFVVEIMEVSLQYLTSVQVTSPF